jgi:signal transduction histidine kinase
VITGISVGRRTVPSAQYNTGDAQRVLDVPADARNLSVEFAALDYTDPDLYGYAYKLDGYDREWVRTSFANRMAMYTNLSPGTYRLRLRVTDHAGAASGSERLINVRVAAAFYQTMWFRGLAVLALLLTLVLTVQARTVLLRARQRELESLVDERTQALVRATEARNSLIENLAHDLRTPLTSLRGYLDRLNLADEALSEAEHSRYIGIAVRQAERLIRLVRELFELVRLEDVLARLTLERFSPVEIVQDVAQEFGSIAENRNIVFELAPGAEAVQIVGDISLFQRLVDNLVDNAVRHTPAEGTITVRLGADGADVVLEVGDTGRGIKHDDLNRIFNRYERGDATGRISGAGLGLAIVKRILELHHGSIIVDSALGVGTRFTVRLPMAGPKPSTPAA